MSKFVLLLCHLSTIHIFKLYIFLSLIICTRAFAPPTFKDRKSPSPLPPPPTRNPFLSRNSIPNRPNHINLSTTSRLHYNKESNTVDQRSNSWVVLVDDSESIRKSVGQYLFDAGYTVSACADAEALIELLTLASSGNMQQNNIPSKLPSVIICDVRMPGTGMDGLELLDLLKNPDSTKVRVTSPSSDLDFVRRQWRKIPVVMLTAKSLTQDRIQGYRKGADVYLPKPFVPEELLSIVDNLIARTKALARDSEDISTLRDVKTDIIEIKSMLKTSTRNNSYKEYGNLQAKRALIANKVSANSSAIVPSWNKSVSSENSQDVLDKLRWKVNVTNVEKEILELLSQGNTNGEIAEAMGFANGKVSRLISNMYSKTFTKTRTELVRWAIEMGHISAT